MINKIPLEPLPEIHEYYKRLVEFEKMILVDKKLSNMSLLELATLYDEYAIILPSVTGETTKHYNHKLYRARKVTNDNKYSTNWQLIKSHSFPKPKYCKSNGRCNLEEKSVFYCSDEPLATLHETGLEKNTEYFISTWKTKTIQPLKFYCMLPHNLMTKNKYSSLASSLSWLVATQSIDDESKHNVYIRNFIADIFSREDYPYPISSMLSDFILYGNEDNIDYILYPSYKTQANYCNMAFKPESVTNKLVLNNAYRYLVEDFDDSGIKGYIMAVGEIFENEIRWRPPNNDTM